MAIQLANNSNNTLGITANMIAFYQNGSGAAPGDSGGPATIWDANNNPIIVGASSWGYSPKDINPTIYTKVRNYSQWIQSITGIVEGLENTSISGLDNVCTNTQYTVSNAIAGSTTVWSISNTNIATVSTTGVVTKIGAGDVILTATVTTPCGGTKTFTKPIRIGGYLDSEYILTGGNNTQQPLYWCPSQAYSFSLSGPPASNYIWSMPTGWTQGPTPPPPYVKVYKAPSSSTPPTGNVSVSFIEAACGITLTKSFYTAFSTSSCIGTDPRFTYSPNPAPNYLYVSVASAYSSTTKIKRIQINQQSNGVTVFDQSYGSSGVLSTYITTSTFQIGTYVLRIYDGSSWAIYQFIR